jgi:hypothetical protein
MLFFISQEFNNIRDDEQKDRVRRMYENRLKIPHASKYMGVYMILSFLFQMLIVIYFYIAVDKTFSDYSSFITKYDNPNYENIMIEANKYVSETKNKYYERDHYENALVCIYFHLTCIIIFIFLKKKKIII